MPVLSAPMCSTTPRDDPSATMSRRLALRDQPDRRVLLLGDLHHDGDNDEGDEEGALAGHWIQSFDAD